MRFTAYASVSDESSSQCSEGKGKLTREQTSVALAASVILKALHERPNFYSACVYLGQSSACIMILTNLTLLAVGSLLFGLQRLLYGPLRPIEMEQLYEKAWFAITETCLAMTIFREEVGAWFIVMFVSLLVARVWGWIGEGRVEVLEQQPPADPRRFHARLSSSLALSFLFTTYMLNYCITTVQQQARPNMMVMFAFEFAVLTVTSMSTCARYGLSLREAAIIRKQTALKLSEQRTVILRDREAAKQRAQENEEPIPEFPPVEDEINELDIDVPGWEDKGRWVFYLDLATDFLKLVLYLTFFCVLCIFYGMPIHIIRDVAITVRSFYNRVTDFIKYRHATRDMNERYPDATMEEIAREDTCIICREPMRPWQPPGAVQGEGPTPMEERLRPKKLPCGHILHFACLRSWLERQQKCPTCRQDVVGPATTATSPQPRQEGGGGAGAGGVAPAAGAAANEGNRPPARRDNHPNNAPRRNRVRFFNLGPVRLGFGAGNDPQALQEEMANQRPRQPRAATDRVNQGARQSEASQGTSNRRQLHDPDRASQIWDIEQQLRREINESNFNLQQLRLLNAMDGELTMLRRARLNAEQDFREPVGSGMDLHGRLSGAQGYSMSPQHPPLHAGDAGLPSGVTIPEGWQVTPLVPYVNREPTAIFPSAGAFPPGASGLPPIAPLLVPENFDNRSSQTSTQQNAQYQNVAQPSNAPSNNDSVQIARNGAADNSTQTARNSGAETGTQTATSAAADNSTQTARTDSSNGQSSRPVQPTPTAPQAPVGDIHLEPHGATSSPQPNASSSAPRIPLWGSQGAATQSQGSSQPSEPSHPIAASSSQSSKSAEGAPPPGESRSDKDESKAATVEEVLDNGT